MQVERYSTFARCLSLLESVLNLNIFKTFQWTMPTLPDKKHIRRMTKELRNKKHADRNKQIENLYFHRTNHWDRINLCLISYPFPKRQILDSSKLKEFAVNNFELNENGRKFSRWLENTVGKGEIACYE